MAFGQAPAPRRHPARAGTAQVGPPRWLCSTSTSLEAAAVRRRQAKPRCWMQLHLGFLCEERLRDTRRVHAQWQLGRQPGTWAWASPESAVQFMGSLEVGAGPASRCEHLGACLDVFGSPAARRRRPFTVEARFRGVLAPVPARAARGRACGRGGRISRGGVRLKVGRQRAETDIRSWSQQSS